MTIKKTTLKHTHTKSAHLPEAIMYMLVEGYFLKNQFYSKDLKLDMT